MANGLPRELRAGVVAVRDPGSITLVSVALTPFRAG